MPPNEPPSKTAQWSMPRCWPRRRCTVTKSDIANSGKSSPYGSSVAGLIDDGPVVPRQPPRMFAHTTNQRFVSTAFPGPMRLSHQPGFRSPGLRPAACASPVRA